MPAPVALFVYRRAAHTRQVLAALGANPEAADTDLIVFSDGPTQPQLANAVDEVRAMCRAWSGFRSLTVVERTANLGLANSIITGVTQVCAEHGRVIVLEDDIVVSPFFLRYMNDALDRYEQSQRVISISAYVFPVAARLPETFFLTHADCWGWATWERAWKLFESDGAMLLAELAAKRLLHRFDYHGAYPYSQMLRDQIAGRNDSWAIRWYASGLLHDKLTLYPHASLVRNIGNDSSGTHCGDTNRFDAPMAERAIAVSAIPHEESEFALRAFESFYRSLQPGPIQRMRSAARRLASRLGRTFFHIRRPSC